MSLPTVTDLKLHNNMTSSADDAELQDVLDAAVEVVEGLIGPIGSPASTTETHFNTSGDVLVLRRMPVAALVSVSSRSGATTTPLTLADYELDAATGVVRVAAGSRFYGTYTVTYTSGRVSVPAGIRMAVMIVAAHLWETQRGTAPTALQLQQPDAFDAGPVGLGYAIPNRARDLLAPFIVPAIA